MNLLAELSSAFSTPVQTLGHLSYVLIIASMMMRDMSWLRAIAIASGVVEIVYRVWFVPDPVSVFWEVLFIAVNLVQLAVLWSERWRSRLSDDDEYFIATALNNAHRSKARKLLAIGEWRLEPVGARLTEEGELPQYLTFVADGTVYIERQGKMIAACSRGDFLGEISFMTGEPASADAVVAKPARCLRFERHALLRIIEADHDIRHALESSFNRNLIDKLIKSNDEKLANATGGAPA